MVNVVILQFDLCYNVCDFRGNDAYERNSSKMEE